MKSKGIIIALTLSLVVNLLLAGYVLGQRSQPGLTPDPTRMFPRWVRTLPEPRQTQLKPLLRGHVAAMRPLLRGMRSHHAALRRALQDEPLQRQGLADVLEEMRRDNQQLQQTSHAAFTEFVTALTPAERQALLEDMYSHQPRRWRQPHSP